jgi:hypothetical protein
MDEIILNEIRQQKGTLHQFWADDRLFYQMYCNSFTDRIIREKRILEFDTPNRVKVTYEYDVAAKENKNKDNENNDNKEEMVFLFLPDKRKNWLKVFFDGKRLTIPTSEKIRDMLYEFVEDDIKALIKKLYLQQEGPELWAEIWKGKKSIPCFVYATEGDLLTSCGLAEITFYDFLVPDDSIKSSWLFDEKYYKYSYPIIAKGNSWLYVKSPSRFDINVSSATKGVEKNPENDPEISSFIIKGIENTADVCFSVAIKVPVTLKFWYASLVALGLLFILTFIVVSIVGIIKDLDIQKFSPVYAQVGISIIAAIIATRGWLMNEETVLGRVSNWITGIVIFIVMLLLGVYTYILL